MTDTAAAAYRPSPRPRPAGAPTRPVDGPKLHVVPPPDDATLQPETEISPGAPSDSETPGQDLAAGGWNARISHLIAGSRRLWATSCTYWTPPGLFTEQPASLQELAVYARTAPWTAQQTGVARTLGVSHYRYLAYPYTCVSRYREWAVQRPGRLIAHLGVIKLLASTDPGHWVVHTVIYPVAQFAGHVFL